MDHLIQIGGVGAPDEPFMEGWTVLSALAAVTGRIRLGAGEGFRGIALTPAEASDPIGR